MIDILTDQFWVGPERRDGTRSPVGSFGDGVLEVAIKNAGLWEKSLKGGAELYKLPTVKPIADKFLADTRAIAGGFLDTNEKYTVTELGKLGVMEGGAAPPSGGRAGRPVQTELTAAIRIAKETQEAQTPAAHGDGQPSSAATRCSRATASCTSRPASTRRSRPIRPTRIRTRPHREGKGAGPHATRSWRRTPWKNVKAQWDVLEAILQGLAIAYPTVGIALTAPGRSRWPRPAATIPRPPRRRSCQMLDGRTRRHPRDAPQAGRQPRLRARPDPQPALRRHEGRQRHGLEEPRVPGRSPRRCSSSSRTSSSGRRWALPRSPRRPSSSPSSRPRVLRRPLSSASGSGLAPARRSSPGRRRSR